MVFKTKMSLCGICDKEINDGKPYDEENLSYCGCEEHRGEDKYEY